MLQHDQYRSKDDFRHLIKITISGLRADISHAKWMAEQGCGDGGYWDRQAQKTKNRIDELERRL